MIYAFTLAGLAILDIMLAAFRAAAGRSGLIDKRAYHAEMWIRAAKWAAVIVVANAALAVAAWLAAPDPQAAWTGMVAAARSLVIVYGLFATAIAIAFALYFAPGEFRVLANVIVFGPLTILRRFVIVGGLVYVIESTQGLRVAVLAICGGVSILAFEPLFGRRYHGHWRALLVEAPGVGEPTSRAVGHRSLTN